MINAAPTVTDDGPYQANAGETLNVTAVDGVLKNDVDPDGDSLAAVLDTAPSMGSLTLNADGSFTYTPDTTASGIDTFTYHASDGILPSIAATVTLEVNGRPVAANDSYQATAGEILSISAAEGVLINDTDPEDDALTAAPDTGPSMGSLTLNANGSFTYTPNATASGVDTFTYYADDGAVQSVTAATVTLEVNAPPKANPQSVTTDENQPINITLVATDGDGDPLTYAIQDYPDHGALDESGLPTVLYTPDTGYDGSDSFSFRANDGKITSNVATVSIDVNDRPIAQNQSVEVPEDSSNYPISLGVTDNDDTVFSFEYSQPAHGTVTGAGPAVYYTPDPDYAGPDEFTFKANDGRIDSNEARITINVLPVNDPPLAEPESVVTDEDTPVTITLSGSDIDGDLLTFSYNQPANGSVTGAGPDVVYTPNLNYHGTDSFSFRANDGTVDSASAQVSITIRPVNDPPLVVDDSYSVAVGQTISVTAVNGLLSNDSDPEGDEFSVHEITQPPAGEATAEFSWNPDGSFAFTPSAGFVGDVTFKYRAEDSRGAVSGEAFVTILVWDGNNPLIDWINPEEYIPSELNYLITRHHAKITLEVKAVDNVDILRVVFKKQDGAQFVEIGTVTESSATADDGWEYFSLVVNTNDLGTGFVYLAAEAYDDAGRRSPQKLSLVRIDRAHFMPLVAR